MKKKFTKYVILAIVILLAELLNAFFLMAMQKYKSNHTPYQSTFIQMLASLVIYAPILAILDKSLKSGSQELIKKTQKVAKHHVLGVVLAFAVAFFLIWLLLANIWYNRNPFEDFVSWLERVI